MNEPIPHTQFHTRLRLDYPLLSYSSQLDACIRTSCVAAAGAPN